MVLLLKECGSNHIVMFILLSARILQDVLKVVINFMGVFIHRIISYFFTKIGKERGNSYRENEEIS